MRAAQLDDNSKVINMIEVERLDVLPNLIDCTGGNIGDTWDGTQFIPAPPKPEPVPDTITPRQCRLQLLATPLGDGNALDAVEAANGTIGPAAKIEWEYAVEVQRSNPLVAAMAGLLGWSDADTDLYFTEAAKL